LLLSVSREAALRLVTPVSPTGRGAAAVAVHLKQGSDVAPAKFIVVNTKLALRKELLTRRREQLAAVAKSEQPTLFEMKDDRRPIADRTAADRYLEPSLFSEPERRKVAT
jgi:hypothetical protein